MPDIDLTSVSYADLSNEVRKRDIAETARREEEQRKRWKEQHEREEAEDRAFCEKTGITYDQYEAVIEYYHDVVEDRW